ncbi:MAG: hypothetical protein B7Y73_03965 [Acidocella sp. 35-58-6]|nr:MAG: hypothetical protein B7Y73_03965 [Acidocella sp. 35-58-6]
MPAVIRTEYGPAGEVLHLIPHPASQLPNVTKRDLEQAWDAARANALNASAAKTAHGFRFMQPGVSPLDLALTDPDAANWTEAIDRVADLGTAHGISVCLRVLALFQLMANATWTRPWFTFAHGGLEFHPALLQAAALAPLTPTGGFAETALRALLPLPQSSATQE